MSALTSILSAALVVLRESFEAFLLVGILLGLLAKLDAKQHRGRVLWGTAAGAVTAIVVGAVLLHVAENLRESYQRPFEALAALLAVSVLTYMVVWMYRHTQHLMGGLSHEVRAAIQSGTLGALFLMPFLAVIREGFETVLFLAADGAPTGLPLVVAVLSGLLAAVLLGVLLFSGVVRLSVERFFAITGALLVLFGGWILANGAHELGEMLEAKGGAWQEPGEFLADVGDWILGAIYVLVLLGWYLRPMLRRRKAASPPRAA